MLIFIGKRLVYMLLTMFAISLILFLVMEINGEAVARRVLGPFTSAEQLQAWLQANGYLRPWYVRYVEWLGNVLSGDFGQSIRFRTPVAQVLWPRLGNTAILAGATFAIMVPLALTLGVLAGMREGSRTDRTITVASVISTSIPEFASAVLLTVIFSTWLGWLPGTSAMSDGWNPVELVLPVMVLVLYGFGYIARMTRASMAEVMQQLYIRTAILKGLPYQSVILRHALRNAMIAPFTVIMLQINWLLSGVIVVEVAFAYKGFGSLILEAALNQDVYLLEAATLVAVLVAVSTQVLADVGYTLLNPRIRFK